MQKVKKTAKKRTVAKPAVVKSTFVDDTKSYTIEGLCDALGVELRTIREARARGLPAKIVGGRKLVISGKDFNQWVRDSAPVAPVPKARNEVAN